MSYNGLNFMDFHFTVRFVERIYSRKISLSSQDITFEVRDISLKKVSVWWNNVLVGQFWHYWEVGVP